MENKESKATQSRPSVPQAGKSYQKPELKKHGKLKNKATQVSTYTYTYIT
jgi:hypothetical protein